MTMEEAQGLIESVFDFDHVGSEMIAVRKNFDSIEAQQDLVEELVKAACEESGDTSSDTMAVMTSAAKERVNQFVKGAKFSQSGCSGL
jgi:hypothetical protein